MAEGLITSIFEEREQRRPLWEEKLFSSIYIGGGTPTTLSVGQIERLLLGLRSGLRSDDAEVSMEMNPGTANDAKLSLLRTLGVTRVSIGVQSFSDRLLTILGRQHTSADAVAAVRLAKAAGLPSVGIDLLYGIPGQSRDEWRATIDVALELRPDHLSFYALSLEQGSRFLVRAEEGDFALPDDECVAEMYEFARRCVLEAGYAQYELSNFALPSHACRHNQHYWNRGEYLGLGPSASSFVSRRRWTNVRSVGTYIDLLRQGRSVMADEELVTFMQAASERLFLGLRKTEGIDLKEYLEHYRSHDWPMFAEQIRLLSNAGLILNEDGRLRLSARGMLMSNEVMARLIP